MSAEHKPHFVQEAMEVASGHMPPWFHAKYAAPALAEFNGMLEQLETAQADLAAVGRELGSTLDRYADLREAAQGFIDTMGLRHSEIAAREVPSGFASSSREAAIELFDVLNRVPNPTCEHVWRDIAGSGALSCDRCGVSAPASEPRA